MQRHFLLSLLMCLSLCALYGQSAPDTIKVKVLPPIQKFYVGNGLDAGIFSSANIQRTNLSTGTTTNAMGIVRFTAFLNLGVSFNFNLSRALGIYTGMDIKNIGFIEHTGGYTVKRRTYNLGAPLGIKLGNMAKKGAYLFLGGGADAPINYKEKSFQVRDQKTKRSSWFSDNTPALMPYMFVGISMRSRITLKAQYYPGNFMSASYVSNDNSYNVHLILLSIGYRVNYSNAKNIANKTSDDIGSKLM